MVFDLLRGASVTRNASGELLLALLGLPQGQVFSEKANLVGDIPVATLSTPPLARPGWSLLRSRAPDLVSRIPGRERLCRPLLAALPPGGGDGRTLLLAVFLDHALSS